MPAYYQPDHVKEPIEQIASSVAAAFGSVVPQNSPKTNQNEPAASEAARIPAQGLNAPFLFTPSRLIYLCKLT